MNLVSGELGYAIRMFSHTLYSSMNIIKAICPLTRNVKSYLLFTSTNPIILNRITTTTMVAQYTMILIMVRLNPSDLLHIFFDHALRIPVIKSNNTEPANNIISIPEGRYFIDSHDSDVLRSIIKGAFAIASRLSIIGMFLNVRSISKNF